MNELEWVRFLKKSTVTGGNVVAGIGDDCAVVRSGKKFLLFSSDLFIEGVHFRRRQISLYDAGRRAAARALSDIVACGGVPLYLGVSCGRPRSLSAAGMKKVYAGIAAYCAQYGTALIGGDTASSEEFFLDIWVVGKADRYVLRSTARRGDHIFLSGPLGKVKFNEVFDLRVKEIQGLLRRYKVTAMIDISDGFVLDLRRILEESGKGAVVYGDALPLTSGPDDLFRGEDYELIFTVDKGEDTHALKKKYHYVGKITSRAEGYTIMLGGKKTKIEVKGYTHF